ncbi:autotransporter outer membrane beta-barrel domain-containing protein [Bartonella sp. CM120XJJH]|uniref:autotransporter outer membrane beta-barrel domain-containing protein n=1 Tax=Bartonella sp. CM120XJJH TaxID=3243544 RepID=UPI0035D09172
MCKKSLLSCTAVIAVMLFNTHLNVYAETLEVSGEKKEVSNTTYEIIHAKDNGEITGNHLTVVGDKDTDIYAVTAEGLGSAITLLQDTTIKGTDFDIRLGLNAKDGATIKMTGGIITVSEIGAFFENSMNDKNKLEGVTISSGKNGHFMDKGINADNKSKVTLENVTVTQANTSIFANDHSEVTILGGAFDGELKGISATEGSAITLTYSKLADNKKGSVQVTSSHGDGLYANGAQSTITMIGGAVTGKSTALLAENGGYIDVTDVTLKTGGTGIGAIANDVDSTIELHGNTVINDAVIGLYAANGSTITMTGGTITAFETGAFFNESKSNKNKLENVTITYANTSISDQDKLENVKTSDNELDPGWESELENEKEEFLYTGITAFAGSHLTLKNVTITQAETSISAEDGSQVRILGGAFNGEHVGLYVMNGSFITLANSKEGSVQVTSSNGDGLYADGLFSTIIMMGGTVTAGNRALFAKKGGYIKVTDVALTTMDGNGNGAASTDPYSFIELDGGTTINNAINGLDAENSGVIIMTGGAVTAKSAALITMNGGYIKVTDVALTTMEGNGYGAASTDPESLIELHGKTTINNALIGLYTENSGTIAMAGGTVTGKSAAVLTKSGGHIKVTDVALTTMDGNGYGAATSDPDSLIELHGKTTINNAFIGLYTENSGTITMAGGTVTATNMALFATNGGHIKVTDVALTTMDGNGYGAATTDPKSLIELYGKTTINNAFIGLNTENSGTITMAGGTVAATNMALLAKSGGHIKLTDVALTTMYGNGYGAATSDPESLIELDGKTTINNAFIGLYTENSGTITMAGGTVAATNMALLAKSGGHIKLTDVALTTMYGNGYGAATSDPESLIELYGKTTINNIFIGLNAENSGAITMTGGAVTATNVAVLAKSGGHIKVTDVALTTTNGNYGAAATDPKSLIELYGKTTINNAVTGLEAENSGTIIMTGGTVTAKTMALFAMNGGHIKVTDVALTTMDGNGYGTAASNPYSLIELHGNTAISNTFIGLYAENGGTIKMTGGTVAAKGSAFVLKNSGYIDVTNVSAAAENSGITFDKSEDDNALEINLTNTKIRTENSIGINADQSIGIANLKNSEISADILLAAKASTKENNFAFTLNANHSVLKGRAKIAENRTARFDLTNKTTWILKTSTKETDDDGKLLAIAQRSRSDISVLNLNDSSIVFNGPVEDHYHTLHIGSGKPDTKAVYNASSEAEIHFNAIWSDGVAIDAQKTDRLLIHGDVAGTTTVYVKVSGDKENVENVSASSNIGGLSLIQVSGEAKEDSFKLKNGYTTIGGTPYKYTLTAYGPVSSYGKANANQNLFDEKDKDFWDFRLQPEFLDPNSKVRTVVPQMASYLVMPNALFYAGLADMAKQNALLANMRTTVFGEQNNLKNNFFLSTYGGTGTLSSKRGPLKYGYGTDIRYAALQAGVTLAAIEGQSTTTHLGLLGTYGQLSFTPKEMQDASKSTLDKWSLTAYGSVQHDSGFYIDTLLSYGIIKGDITNAIIGKTAKLNNVKMLSISTTVGKQFSIGMEGVTFEPQIQLAYQHLMFDTIEDADNLKIDMKNPSQWLIRVGGRLTKTIMTTENGPAISFYGKVNLIKTFGDKGKVQISKNFDLDPMGTAIEGGVGINAQLSHNFSLYGDVSYQQKLQKTGISGASFSGGIRYQF